MKEIPPKILLVEDETSLRRMLEDNLSQEGYAVLAAGSAEEAKPLLARERPHLIVLDLRLPGEGGLDLLKRLRAEGTRTPVLILTARSQEADKVLGLEMGADDYLTKPFGLPELLARVKALLRRAAPAAEGLERARLGAAEVDFRRRLVRKDGAEEPLTHFETELLSLFVRRHGEVLSRAEILAAVWGQEADPTNRVVDNVVVQLRRKVEKDPKKPRHILTVHGTGYRLQP